VGRPPLLHALKTAGWMTLLGAPIMLVMFCCSRAWSALGLPKTL
jgi:hypothetical protein